MENLWCVSTRFWDNVLLCCALSGVLYWIYFVFRLCSSVDQNGCSTGKESPINLSSEVKEICLAFRDRSGRGISYDFFSI